MNTNFGRIREQLERRRGELSARYRRVKDDLARTRGALSADFSEQAVEVQNDETLDAIGRTAEADIVAIDAALHRLSTGEYGICAGCGRPIDAQRLVVSPQSITCAQCGV